MAFGPHPQLAPAIRSFVSPLLLLGLALMLAGCSAVASADKIFKVVEAEGVEAGEAAISSDFGGAITLDVRYATREQTTEARDREMDRVAQAIWRNAPVDFDQLEITAVSRTDKTETTGEFWRSRLRVEYGERPPGLDRDVGSGVLRDLRIFGLAAASVLTTIAVLLIVLMRRSRKRRLAAGPGPRGELGAWAPPHGRRQTQPPGYEQGAPRPSSR
jgi:hypothetical protein